MKNYYLHSYNGYIIVSAIFCALLTVYYINIAITRIIHCSIAISMIFYVLYVTYL